MWIIVKLSLASGQTRYFGPFKTAKQAKDWGDERWVRNEESWWGVTKLESEAIT